MEVMTLKKFLKQETDKKEARRMNSIEVVSAAKEPPSFLPQVPSQNQFGSNEGQ
jgi:hypothetical protein